MPRFVSELTQKINLGETETDVQDRFDKQTFSGSMVGTDRNPEGDCSVRVGEIVARLEALRDEKAVAGMARYGITASSVYGVSLPNLRAIAKDCGRAHDLAIELWKIPNRETRILAGMLADPERVSSGLMERWVVGLECWDICDQTCMNCFEKTALAYAKAVEWSRRDEEFVKRAGFVLMARLAVSDKSAADAKFEPFFPRIIEGAGDARNYVKKAVSWALRQIGKRNPQLHGKAVHAAESLARLDTRSARWIAADALRELRSEKVRARFEKRHRRGG
jgi:3-methyladenine DNA glycosylase AlkD